jgi:predicted transcriptional regulator
VKEASAIIVMKTLWLCAWSGLLPLSDYVDDFSFPYGPTIRIPKGPLVTDLMRKEKEIFRVEEGRWKGEIPTFSLLPRCEERFTEYGDRCGIRAEQIVKVYDFVRKLYVEKGFEKAHYFFHTLAEWLYLFGLPAFLQHGTHRRRSTRTSAEDTFMQIARYCQESPNSSIRAITQGTGIATSSLYKHLRGWLSQKLLEKNSGLYSLTRRGSEILEAYEKIKGLRESS